MKKYFILPLTAVAFLFTFTACLEVQPDVDFPKVVLPALGAVTPAQANVFLDYGVDATITAVVTERDYPITSVVVEWSVRLGDISEGRENLTMTREDNLYTTTIFGHDAGIVAYWRVVVTKANGETEQSPQRTITWRDPSVPEPGVIAAWHYTMDNFPTPRPSQLPATSGNIVGTSLKFYYADGTYAGQANPARALLRGDQNGNRMVNAEGITAAGWLPTGTTTITDIGVEESAGWVITLSTTGFENITFSADQGAGDNGPAFYRVAWRISETNTWTVIPDFQVTRDQINPQDMLHSTISNLALPAGVNNQAFVQVRVWISNSARRSDGTLLAQNGGNSSINNIVFRGDTL